MKPVGGVPRGPGAVEGCGEQALDLMDGERDETGVSRRGLARSGRGRGLGVGAVPELRGDDGADRQGGHHKHEVAEDRGVKARLALVQAEVALSELEPLFSQPPLMPVKWTLSLAGCRVLGR